MLVGCAVQPGKRIVTYSAATTALPKPAVAKQPGIYGLYPDDGLNPLNTVELEKGDPFGFRQSSDGTIVGFANGKEYPLTAVLASEYAWKYMGKAGSIK
jgi:hypothetical protein